MNTAETPGEIESPDVIATLTPSPDDETEHRQAPRSEAFKAFIAAGWETRTEPAPSPLAVSAHAAARRAAISAAYPGERLVLPAGSLRVRSNDTDHRFRPHSAFAHLTGLGTDREPDAALVLEPLAAGAESGQNESGQNESGQNESGQLSQAPNHTAVLYIRPSSPRDTEEFYANARYGELWVGPRPSLAEVRAETGLQTEHLDDLSAALVRGLAEGQSVRIVRGADEELERTLATARRDAALDEDKLAKLDDDLARSLSELRLVKDDYEIAELRRAIEVTALGFGDIVRALPRAVGHARGERVVERAFEGRAREEGNGVGYDTIAAAGPHACTLHWIRNDGVVRDGELILVDAGAEVDSLYTADVTRTLPVSGRFSPAQREVYEAVLEAADAAFAVVRPGVRFREVHAAAMRVIAQKVHAWGLLPGTVEESLADEGQFHRRWMVHGTSHHLGLDVHDCAQARRSMYLDAELQVGMVFTIEPGLYFFEDDLTAPQEFRGIGVRIEDDVLVTAGGYENLSAGLPRTVAGIEKWMADQRAR